MDRTERTSVWGLARDTSQVGYARELVGKALAAHGWEADEAVLMASEIVTNAIEHGSEPIELRITVMEGRLWCGVFDGGTALPCMRRPDALALRGRGLALVSSIVAELDGRWGTTVAMGGKTVWFSVPVTAAVLDGSRVDGSRMAR